uniref:NADH-ubiquinone oxidoreductase chain 5 n=1 Tax=Galathealinum brachiosum TaxID=53701 RepID=A0A0E3DR81_9ANNE|nr:NADH dehydrogenase subunit 5 [Galathealinum brachiosum]AIL54803.1 NADH dehydrogenase subunit 5 [Galathealinum brachiosum]
MIFFLSPMIIFFFMILSFIMSMYLNFYNTTILIEWEIYNISSLPIFFSLILDMYGMLFMATIMFISFNVLIFSKQYMSNDLFIIRFTKLVCLFIFSMVLLVVFPNLIILMIGWDGLGMSSFLLIIYFQNFSSLSAGVLTTLINRFGDILLILSISLMFNMSHWNIMNMWDTSFSLYMMLLILCASMTKSAQIPFSSWLPAAMEAPTPVSALVHSSTLVTAGVFLLFRFYPFMSQFILFNKILLIFSTMTMLMASLSASFQYDLKKIIALSTLSQLGLMMLSLSLFSPLFTFFHLITHAMFKALLFLCAGTIIFYISHNQDLRFIGNMNKIMPLTTSSMFIANMALCGIPFLAGFFSKDLILEESFMTNLNFFIFMMILLATGLTANYSFRMMYFLMWSPQLFFPFKNFFNNNMNFIVPMMLMSSSAIIMGSVINWMVLPPMLLMMPLMFKMIIPLITLIGILLPFILSKIKINNKPFFFFSLSSMWFLSPLTTQNLILTPMTYSLDINLINDQGWIELFFNNKYIFNYLIPIYFSFINISINKIMLMIFFIFYPMIFIY